MEPPASRTARLTSSLGDAVYRPSGCGVWETQVYDGAGHDARARCAAPLPA